ncbi:MAG: prepilin-type N-terminal cleavage/methylation domain-containing protein [Phycisphaerales bacterium]|nr:prepilin-type N-terminal cleavage/methylation domain-containing protein [Phycisphaerales bacterium]
MKRNRLGFTIVELLVVVAIIALLIGILLPALGKARESALTTNSLTNLRNIGAACASYESDWGGRQFTNSPDDFGMYGGTCADYVAQQCLPPLLVGWDGTLYWGLWIGSAADCPLVTTTCANWYVIEPNSWDLVNQGGFGLWRGPSVQAFNNYVNGRYYDPLFWAPKDVIGREEVQVYFQNPNEFTYHIDHGLHFPTYCWSPAAMWAPDVMSARDGFQAPATLPAAWRSPSSAQALFPELKSRVAEHWWLQNRDAAATNPNFSGIGSQYTFNQGYNSSPATLYFDSHVSLMPISSCMSGDEYVRRQQAGTTLVEKGLWMRGTPFGATGYFGNEAFDNEVNSSAHVLTTGGILGRDLIRAR